MLATIKELIYQYEEHSKDAIHLVASENLPDVKARIPYLMDLFARYSFDSGDTWKYWSYCLEDLERETERLLQDMLRCNYTSLKPISGLNGMLTTISALNEPGNTIMLLDPLHGGHTESSAIVQRLNMKYTYLPFDRDTWQIDVKELAKRDDLNKIDMVYLDLCMAIFPQPIRQLREVFPKKTIIVYDASHVLGLILGGQFQQPLEEGADVIIASTHKTFPGPHKAIFATNKRLLKWLFVQESIHYISHHHMADVSCLGLVLEKGAEYFTEYADNIVHNSSYLAQQLYQRGVKVQLAHLGFTASHQIWIDCGEKEELDLVIEQLNSLNLVVNGGRIPSMHGKWGIRIGVQEITKQGITEKGLQGIAEIISSVIWKQENQKKLETEKYQILQHEFTNRCDSTIFEQMAKAMNEEQR